MLVDYDKTLGPNLIQACIDKELFKQAAQYTKLLRYESLFPNVFMLLKRQSLTKLVKQQKWRLAVTLVGSDPMYRNLLLDILRQEEGMGEAFLSLQEEYALEEQDGKLESTSEPTVVTQRDVGVSGVSGADSTYSGGQSITDSDGLVEGGATLEKYLKLEMPDENILWIHDLASILHATPLLLPPTATAPTAAGESDNSLMAGEGTQEQIHVVGFDVEWKTEVWKVSSNDDEISTNHSSASSNRSAVSAGGDTSDHISNAVSKTKESEAVRGVTSDVSLTSLKSLSQKRRKKRKKECVSKPKAALLQLATRTHAFLFDLPAIFSTNSNSLLSANTTTPTITDNNNRDAEPLDELKATIEAFNHLISLCWFGILAVGTS